MKIHISMIDLTHAVKSHLNRIRRYIAYNIVPISIVYRRRRMFVASSRVNLKNIKTEPLIR